MRIALCVLVFASLPVGIAAAQPPLGATARAILVFANSSDALDVGMTFFRQAASDHMARLKEQALQDEIRARLKTEPFVLVEVVIDSPYVGEGVMFEPRYAATMKSGESPTQVVYDRNHSDTIGPSPPRKYRLDGGQTYYRVYDLKGGELTSYVIGWADMQTAVASHVPPALPATVAVQVAPTQTAAPVARPRSEESNAGWQKDLREGKGEKPTIEKDVDSGTDAGGDITISPIH